jgi:hypothetical protein
MTITDEVTATTTLQSVEIFTARAEARALLCFCGELELADAVDELQAVAERDGLVAAIGQDEVQRIIADVFAHVEASGFGTNAAWESPGWRQAALDYHAARGANPTVVEIEPERLAALRALMADDVSIDQACHQLNAGRGQVAASTLQTAEYLAAAGDAERWGVWLARHDDTERAAILQHLAKMGQRQ